MENNANPSFDYSLIQQVNEIADKENNQTEVKPATSEIEEKIGMLTVMPANKWVEQAKNRPIPKMLFSEFWFESEVCILFANTNLGKSVLSVQIADSISKGKPIPGFKLEAEKQPVLYFDFELSDKQFERRYSSEYEKHYVWDGNLFRIEINPDADFPNGKSFEDYLIESLEQAIKETGAKVLVIDNITYLNNDNEKAKEALPLMKHLKALKQKYGLSILALAHTPKIDLSKPINQNHIQGSKMIINFCDSAFAIGASSQDGRLRYLKQVKQRNTEQVYDAENVCVCQIVKPDNFLQFEFVCFDAEHAHLKQYSESEKEQRISDALELKMQGHSNVAVAKKFGVSEGTVRKWLKKAAESKN